MNMTTLYYILLGICTFLAIIVIVLATVTGKGDAMSGGGSVRTSFRGKDSIEDKIAGMILILGLVFMAVCLLLDFMSVRVFKV